MKISNVQSYQNFNGIYLKNVTPNVEKNLRSSEVIQNISKNYDVFIEQYQRKTKESFGDVVEYGLKYKIKEIVPNLFKTKSHFSKVGNSEFALDPKSFKNKKEMQKTIDEDLSLEAELLDFDCFKNLL